MKLLIATIGCALFANIATGQDSAQQRMNLHFQATYIYQDKPAFHSLYDGPNSLGSKRETENSLTATMFVGLRLWKGGEIYVNPEVAGGSGLSGAFGMAASTNGETFRVGDPAPSVYLARGYFRQIIALGDAKENTDDGQNQLRGQMPVRYLSLTVGKFSLGDFFDNNDYSNSPRTQFLNWALMSNSAWDYAANLRGYTAGFVGMVKYDQMQYKIGIAAEPKVANGAELNIDYGKARGINAEVVRTYNLSGKGGHLRLLGYCNETNMGLYTDAMHDIDSSGRPDVILAEQPSRVKYGFGLNCDQKMSESVGIFGRIGWNDGKTETWAFTEADRTISLGASINGKSWKRSNDVLGLAFVANGLSADHRNYLAAGGLGFQLGDSRLNYSNEMVTEVYYSCKPTASGIWLSGDYQFAMNPGYNKDRGPVHVFALRLHAEL